MNTKQKDGEEEGEELQNHPKLCDCNYKTRRETERNERKKERIPSIINFPQDEGNCKLSSLLVW